MDPPIPIKGCSPPSQQMLGTVIQAQAPLDPSRPMLFFFVAFSGSALVAGGVPLARKLVATADILKHQ